MKSGIKKQEGEQKQGLALAGLWLTGIYWINVMITA
jgi:hypothetical protein